MPDIRNQVWNLSGVPDLPKEKQIAILTRLQARVHELYDALMLAHEWIMEGESDPGLFAEEPELQAMFKVVNESLRSSKGGKPNVFVASPACVAEIKKIVEDKK